jgi:hypothetical protein
VDKNEKRKEDRRRLHEIYVNHDVAAFREFLRDHIPSSPQYARFVDATGDVLSYLMHTAKSQLMYLGDLWQQSRNFVRWKEMWEKSATPLDQVPLCVTCKHFREAPREGESPCMHLGGTPADIACRAYSPVKSDPI